MQDKWVCIAWKEESEDYCRGHIISSYRSNFMIAEFDSRKQVIHFVAEYEHRNNHLEYGESEYNIIVIKGEQVRDISDFLKQAESLVKEKDKAKEESKRREKEAKELARQRKTEEEGLNLLAALKAKYER